MNISIPVALKTAFRDLPYRLRDRRLNQGWATADQRFLVVRQAADRPYRWTFLLEWMEREFPDIRRRFELRLLPCRIADFSRYVLHVPWLQDPVAQWSPLAYRQAMQLADQCAAHGVAVLNAVDRTARSIKSECTRRISTVGIRTPRIVAIDCVPSFRETLGGLDLPLLVRQDRGHGRRSYLVETRKDLDRIPFRRLDHPIASEFIDVRCADGCYRKYRFFAAGDRGVTRHLIIGRDWELRAASRVRTADSRDEELAYLRGRDPFVVKLQRAREALGFDLAAFDYSLDRQGRLVVWEANPYPEMNYAHDPDQAYMAPYVERSLAVMLGLYLNMAGLPLPNKLEDLISWGIDQGTTDRQAPEASRRLAA